MTTDPVALARRAIAAANRPRGDTPMHEHDESPIDKAEQIVFGILLPAAKEGPDQAAFAANAIGGNEARAALIYMVLFDRDQQGAQRLSIDTDTLNALYTAADDGPNAVRDAANALALADAREALTELLALHTKLLAIKATARQSAELN